jgi:hypothetical protein
MIFCRLELCREPLDLRLGAELLVLEVEQTSLDIFRQVTAGERDTEVAVDQD